MANLGSILAYCHCHLSPACQRHRCSFHNLLSTHLLTSHSLNCRTSGLIYRDCVIERAPYWYSPFKLNMNVLHSHSPIPTWVTLLLLSLWEKELKKISDTCPSLPTVHSGQAQPSQLYHDIITIVGRM